MSTVIMDDCLRNLFYAKETMKDYVTMTDYQLIFEASDPVVSTTAKQNEQVRGKTDGFIMSAVKAVIKMLKDLFGTIKDFVLRCTMSGKERDAFKSFREQMAKDPKLKNKKITIMDFRSIQKTYDNLLSEVDQNIRENKKNEKHPVKKVIDKVKDFLGGTTKATTTIVSCDVALRMADSNVQTAKALNFLLNTDINAMESLESVLGKKGAADYKRQINSAANDTFLHRLKCQIFHREYNDINECIKATLDSLSKAGFVNPATFMGKSMLKNDYTRTVIKTTGKAAVKGGATVAKKELKDRAMDYLNDKVFDKDHKQRDAKKSGDGRYKSMASFFTGK